MQRKVLQALLVLFTLLSGCNLPITPTAIPVPSEPATTQPAVRDPLSVVIIEPASGVTFPALAAIPVRVQVAGPVSTVELLVDDEPFQDSQTPLYTTYARWKWSTAKPGMHVLKARVSDADGKVYTSNPVIAWISATATQTSTLYHPQVGDTLTGLAARFNTTPQLLHTLNSFLPSDFSAPLPLDRPLKILNQYPPEFSTRFPALSVNSPQSVAATLQTQFLPAAKSPLESNSPNLADHLFVDQVYYYISLDQGPWSRVPREQGEFLTPKNGYFDVDEALAPLLNSAPASDIHVLVDAWGWQGGTLVFIGRFERVVTANQKNEPWAILPGFLEICSAGQNCTQGEVTADFAQHVLSSQGGKHTLRWQTPPGIADGLWQVSTQSFNNDCALDPAYLYASGAVAAAGKDTTFTVEFPPYTGTEQTFFVRVLPIVNGQPNCTPSNTVTLRLKTPENIVVPTVQKPPVPPVAFEIEITDFTPIHFPDYDYRYCVTVVDNPFYQYQDLNALFASRPDAVGWISIANGTDICPVPYVYEAPSVWEQIGDFLKEAVNTIAMVYNTLKTVVVDLVATLNPVCLAANQVSDSQSVDDACRAVAEIAVNAAMTYVGLPPSLPNYDELIETGKGELTNLIADQLAEQTGIPCPEDCKALIRDGIDAAIAEIEAQVADSACLGEKEAHANGIEPLCIPPDIKVKPMHEGQLEPALVTVQLTRKADVPDSAFPDPQLYKTSCLLQVNSAAENNTWNGQQVFLGADYQSGQLLYWQGTAVQGQPFEQLNIPAPGLAPGESISLTLPLNPKRGVFPPGEDGFWLPGRTDLYADYYFGSQLQNYYGDQYDDWEYLYFGSQLTINAQATCSTSFMQSPAGSPATALTSSTSSAGDDWVATIPAQGE